MTIEMFYTVWVHKMSQIRSNPFIVLNTLHLFGCFDGVVHGGTVSDLHVKFLLVLYSSVAIITQMIAHDGHDL